MSKFLISCALVVVGLAAISPRSPASQAEPSATKRPAKITWNVEPVGMVEPHPPVEIYYNPLPRGTGRRQWANKMQSD